MKSFFILILIVLAPLFSYCQGYVVEGIIKLEESKFSEHDAEIIIKNGKANSSLDQKGNFVITVADTNNCSFIVFSKGFESKEFLATNNDNEKLNIYLKRLATEIKEISIEENNSEFNFGRLKSVDGMAIYAGKKTELIEMNKATLNKATNNPRQIYGKVAGLNIWENDGAGIQLSIGGRGLNPSRVTNFNTRQNGYDISADALGYPESYYTPSAEAIERIEIVRGAASLQYGTQFGGFINFRLNDGPDTAKFELKSRQTAGSFGLFNSFNSIGGNYKKIKYYTFYQYKTGNGWRDNSDFDVHQWYGKLNYELNPKMTISVEHTFMSYLAQQAGGLTDRQFLNNPQQSFRERNWFQVSWNLSALKFNYIINSKISIDSRLFMLHAHRYAVGNLSSINRQDIPNTPRNLLKDEYLNWGIENRLLNRYQLFKKHHVFLVGMRYYMGNTDRKQGLGSRESGPDFGLSNENIPENSFYNFPSQNIAFFAENIFYLSDKFTLTPGARFEFIDTKSDGFYFERSFNLAGEVISERQINEARENQRQFMLFGLGLSYKPTVSTEIYSNLSQNYRSINFNDMRIINPSFDVDTNLMDESGYSFDIGIRGNFKELINYDVNFFYLGYNDRIGEVRKVDSVLFRPIRFRTNVSDSRSLGLESYVELSLSKLLGYEQAKHQVGIFVNFSYIDAVYINSEESAFEGNEVELAPPIIFRSGFNYSYKGFNGSLQYSYTAEHYSDATNAEFTSDAVNGLIFEYAVLDLSLGYEFKMLSFEAGINNLLNEIYFTRRAAGYPGPGIIPSDPRNFYFTLGLKL